MDFQSFLCQTIGSFIKEKSGTATTKNRWKEYRKQWFWESLFLTIKNIGCSCFWDVKQQELDFTQQKSGTCLMKIQELISHNIWQNQSPRMNFTVCHINLHTNWGLSSKNWGCHEPAVGCRPSSSSLIDQLFLRQMKKTTSEVTL